MPELLKAVDMDAGINHMILMRAISNLVSVANGEGMDALEVLACLGATAGACISSSPDPQTREIARQSVIASMDKAIVDFGKGRQQ